MIEFLNRLFGRQPSSVTAKERLRVVLLADHLALAPELMDDLKRELIEVISRYVEVDRTKIEVNFEQQEKAVAMLANIPILSVHPPKPRPPAEPVAKSDTNARASQDAAPRKPRRRRKRTPAAATSNPAPAT